VTDPADLTHDVLMKVAEFIRKLPADQLADLASGAAKLELVPKGGRVARATTPRKATAPAVSADKVLADIVAIGDRAGATQYVTDLGLGVPAYKALAKGLDISVPSSATKAKVIAAIVEWTIGRRLDAEAVTRRAGG
jgi:hypothetical protein